VRSIRPRPHRPPQPRRDGRRRRRVRPPNLIPRVPWRERRRADGVEIASEHRYNSGRGTASMVEGIDVRSVSHGPAT
jgi:hypothetical protein